MKLLEYESKALLALSKIAVPKSSIVKAGQQPTQPLPYVLKSQVPTGGRGKAGGVVVIEESQNPEEIDSIIKKLLNLPIKGFVPRVLLAEEKINIQRELYLSLLVDRASQSLKLLAHTNGGVAVEDNKDFKTWLIDGDSLNADVIGQELADYYQLPDQTFALQDLIENLAHCLVDNDATLIEINPLILTTDNKLVAGDCKMTLDDAAGFRHDWNFEQKPAETNFVTIDPNGNVATIANGAGLAMATVDAAFEAGLRPANFLDIGGGANSETLLKAFQRIVTYPNIQAIVINIFAGITRSDEVAKAIISARQQIDNLPTLCIRIAGTNDEVAKDILTKENIALMPDLASCLKAAKEVIDV